MGDAFKFGEVQAFNNYLCSTVHVVHAHKMRGLVAVVLAIRTAYLVDRGRPAATRAAVPPRYRGWNLAMTTFDKREEAFERKFVVDEELKFKADARRNRLLGLWAAGRLGLSGDAAASYAKEVVAADFEAAGGVPRKVTADLAAKGVAVSDVELDAKMAELMAQAIAQVKAGTSGKPLVRRGRVAFTMRQRRPTG